MAIEVVKLLCPESKKNIKFPYSMEPQFFVVHNTANDASARNENAYMCRNDLEVSFHYVVDDKEVIQCLPTNVNAWHCGDGANGKGNRNGIGVEICYSLSGGPRFTAAEKLAAQFIAQELKKRNWGIDKVTKHQDYNGKYCPHRTLDMGWTRFVNMVKDAMEEDKKKEETSTTSIKVGDLVKLSKDAVYYDGKAIPSWVKNLNWYVKEVSGDRVVIDKSEDGKYAIASPVNAKYLTVVKKATTTTTKPTTTTTTTKPTTTTTTTTGTALSNGAKLNLTKVALYASATVKTKATSVTGTYYVWSKTAVNGRIRITTGIANVGKSGQVTGWISEADAKKALGTTAKPTTPAAPKIEVGKKVKVNKGAKTYDGKKLASFVYSTTYKVKEISGKRVVLTYAGIVVAAVNIDDLTLA